MIEAREAINYRNNVLLLAIMAQVAMIGVQLGWSASPDVARHALFGPRASAVILLAIMWTVVLAMLTLVLRHISHRTRQITAALTALAVGCLGVMGIALQISYPSQGILLAWAWTLTLPLLWECGVRSWQ